MGRWGSHVSEPEPGTCIQILRAGRFGVARGKTNSVPLLRMDTTGIAQLTNAMVMGLLRRSFAGTRKEQRMLPHLQRAPPPRRRRSGEVPPAYARYLEPGTDVQACGVWRWGVVCGSGHGGAVTVRLAAEPLCDPCAPSPRRSRSQVVPFNCAHCLESGAEVQARGIGKYGVVRRSGRSGAT